MPSPRGLKSLGKDWGLVVLGLCLAANGGFSLYSSVAGISEAVAFVHPKSRKVPKLKGALYSYATLLPATQQFGYFAPQVCSEFRVQVRLGDSKTSRVRDAVFELSSEAELLLSSLNTAAQDEAPARAIAAAYASHALDQSRDFDYARAYVQAELLPPLREAAKGKSQWVTIRGYYFKK